MNNAIYGQSLPLLYDLNNINIPVHFFAGKRDILVVPEDIMALFKEFKNCPKLWIKFYEAGHCSFLWGRSTPYFADLFDILQERK